MSRRIIRYPPANLNFRYRNDCVEPTEFTGSCEISDAPQYVRGPTIGGESILSDLAGDSGCPRGTWRPSSAIAMSLERHHDAQVSAALQRHLSKNNSGYFVPRV